MPFSDAPAIGSGWPPFPPGTECGRGYIEPAARWDRRQSAPAALREGWDPSFGAGENEILAIGTPHRAHLHEARVVGSGERLKHARGLAVPAQNSARGIKDLQKAVILEIGHVIVTGRLAGAEAWSGLMVVTTNRPSGETCDMKPARSSL